MIEPLEPRQLRSVTPTTSAAPEAITLGRDGVIVLRGGALDNQFSILKNTNGNIGLTVTRFPTATRYGIANDLSSGQTFTASYRPRDFKSIVVLGGAGFDAVRLDDVTQAYTTRRYTEYTAMLTARVPSLPAHWINQPFYAAMPGQYSGEVKNWINRSADRITSAAADKASAGVLFMGDSLVERFTQTGADAFEKFKPYHPVDLGLTGDTTNQLLYRIEYQGLLDGARPRVIVLCIGSNNIAISDDAEATFTGIKEVITQIRQRLPRTKLLISSILPRIGSFENKVVNRVNDKLSTLDNGTTTRFLNVTSTFTRGFTKYYRPQDIHLNSYGYAAWAGLIAPLLTEMYGGV